MTNEPVFLTIHCLVYNHEPFLRECLDGFVMQKTNFRFEAIVHDDASTDNSAKIIQEYAEKYPNIIKPILQKENQWSKHADLGLILKNATAKTTKYIATCEGDDYWTDPNKLQKQVDFLESHPDYVACGHDIKIKYEKKNVYIDDVIIKQAIENDTKTYYIDFTKEDYLKESKWLLHTISVVRRNIKIPEKTFFDTELFYFLFTKGKIAILKDKMGVYRKHSGGMTNRTIYQAIKREIIDFYSLYKRYKDKMIIYRLSCKEFVLLYDEYHNYGIKKAIKTLREYRHITDNYVFFRFLISFPKQLYKMKTNTL
ncbi:MAG: glycosyltransferase [Bacteroidales bacterium]|nr:glycosyltransferase [Bacteroidales bacterium]